MGTNRSRYGWPALMRIATAREYLGGMSLAQFKALVAPHLEARSVGNETRYTRQSLDGWIDAGADEHAAQDDLDYQPKAVGSKGAADVAPPAILKRLGLVPEEDVAELLGISVKSLKNRPRSDLPEFVKAGRRRLFKLASLQKYLEARTIR